MPAIQTRRREQECDGVKGNAMEESPQRPEPQLKPSMKSLSKVFNFQPVKVNVDGETSEASTPKEEGHNTSKFKIIEKEKVKDENGLK
mmetsp:Transcript_18304/g.13300  ORF Transcript_18304/g.13300 Transcript_18304/m.13300 type:complete len:88 (+) Transcript_18304:536-799(+)